MLNSIDRHLATTLTGLSGTRSLYDTAGRSAGSERLSGITLTIAQDAATHQASITADTSSAVTLSSSATYYNTLGQVWKTVDAAGTATWYIYDAAGRQTDTIQAIDVNQNGTIDASDTNSDGIPDTGAERLVTHIDYDGLGRAYRTTDANGHTTTTQFDDQGRTYSGRADNASPSMMKA